jgi:NitT/TauT family transport system ATP-binding protein
MTTIRPAWPERQSRTRPPTTARARTGETRFDEVAFRPEPDDDAVVAGCSFTVAAGEVVALIGPSGCGKSTLAYLLAGYHRPTSGRLTVDGRPVTGPSAERLLLFQETALLPWLTTVDNVLFGPRARRESKAQADQRARELLARMGLTDFADRYPGELSGGMQRRAELARALINEPAVLILDEPFRGLDALTRELMQEFCAALLAEQRRTTLFITTDIDEAILMADRLLILTPRPTAVAEELTIDLPRPRQRRQLLDEDSAQAAKARALSLLRGDHPSTD